MHCTWRLHDIAPVVVALWAVLAHFVLRMCTNCCLPSSNQILMSPLHSATQISNNLEIRQHFLAITLTFDIWLWMFVDHQMSCDQTLCQIWLISSYLWFNTFLPTLLYLYLRPLDLKCLLLIGCHVFKLCIEHEQNRTIHGRVIDHLVNFSTFSPLQKLGKW